MIDTDNNSPVREGDILANKYRVEKVLGVGGMGVVVAATHIELDQRVALKFVLPSALQDESAIERFLREAKAAVRLKSEHVAKVLDVGKLESGAPYMVMEFLEGSDLGTLLTKDGPLPFESAADYIAQACEAVAEAHSQGIIHRDIKPQNLFLTRRVGGAPLVKVLDFGVSKVSLANSQQNLTQTMTVMGSPLYMSPEQMRSAKNVDPRSDIWALGVVLYELLTGRVPFEAESMPELCLKVVTDEPAPISIRRHHVPPALEDVVMRCLQKKPDDRFNDCAELASALEDFVTPASRISIERARMVLSGMRNTIASRPGEGFASPSKPVKVVSPSGRAINNASSPGMPTLAAADGARAITSPEVQRTPAPWAGTQGDPADASTKKRKGVVIAIGGVVVAAAAIGGVFFAMRIARETPPSSNAAAASVNAPPPPPPDAPTGSANAGQTMPPALTLAPTASADSPVGTGAASANGATAAGAASSASAQGAARLPPGAMPLLPSVKPSAGRPTPTTKPTVRDDDIPTMR